MKRVRRDLSTPSQTRLLTRVHPPSSFPHMLTTCTISTCTIYVYYLRVLSTCTIGPHPRRRWAVGEACQVFDHSGHVGPHAHILVVGQNILRHWLEVWVGHRPCRLDQKCVRARRKVVSCAGCPMLPPKPLRWHDSDWSNKCPVARTHSLSLDSSLCSFALLLTRFAPFAPCAAPPLSCLASRSIAPSLHRYIVTPLAINPEQTSPSGVTFASTAARKRP